MLHHAPLSFKQDYILWNVKKLPPCEKREKQEVKWKVMEG